MAIYVTVIIIGLIAFVLATNTRVFGKQAELVMNLSIVAMWLVGIISIADGLNIMERGLWPLCY